LPISRGILGEFPKIAKLMGGISYGPELYGRWLNLLELFKKDDIVHFLWVTSPSVESVVIPRISAKVKQLVHTAHNILPHREKEKDYYFFKKIYPFFAHIMLHSQSTMNELLSLFPEISKSNTLVLPVGNYENFYSTHDKTTDADKLKIGGRVFLFMGPLKRYKGFDILCKAISMLNRNDFKVIVKAKRVPDNPCFINYSINLPYHRLGILYRSADVVIIPYTKISLSTVLLESAYFSKPVIASRIGALGEIVRDGIEGLLVEPSSPESLKLAIEKMLNMSDKELKVMGEALKHRSIENYPWSTVADKLLSIYS
jgi:glycosyltransferase involved in cell wall biosynthesis